MYRTGEKREAEPSSKIPKEVNYLLNKGGGGKKNEGGRERGTWGDRLLSTLLGYPS